MRRQLELVRMACRFDHILFVLAMLFGTVPALAAPPASQPATARSSGASSDGEPREPQHTLLDRTRPAELKVKRAATGHLLVWTQINEQDAGWFILDTGAGMNCVDKSLAERLGLPDEGDVEAKGMGGSAAARFRRYQSFAFGPVRLEDGQVVELNLKPYGLLMGETISGIIGNESFQAGVFDINLASATARVMPAGDSVLDGNAASWGPITLKGRRPFVTGSIEGHDEGLFLFDTGANGSILVHAPTVNKFELLTDRQTKISLNGGVGGIKATRSGTIKTLELAGQSLTDVPAVFSKATDGLTSDEATQGTIGIDLLKKFRLIVDYPRKQVALLPLPAPTTAPASAATTR